MVASVIVLPVVWIEPPPQKPGRDFDWTNVVLIGTPLMNARFEPSAAPVPRHMRQSLLTPGRA